RNSVHLVAPLAEGGIGYSWGVPTTLEPVRTPEQVKHYWQRIEIIGHEYDNISDVKLISGKVLERDYLAIIAQNEDQIVHFWQVQNEGNHYVWTPPTIIMTGVSGPAMIKIARNSVHLVAPLAEGGIGYRWGVPITSEPVRTPEQAEHSWQRIEIIGHEYGNFEDVKLIGEQIIERDYLAITARNGGRLAHFWQVQNEGNHYVWTLPRFFY
ncbi:hypothetical protein OCF52_26405, partial [Bacillus cereus]|nr:hypothetical protein [Bacillus cereus]